MRARATAATVPTMPDLFYRTLAELVLRVLDEELGRRGIDAAPLPATRTRGSVEGDAFECGVGPP